MKKYLLFSSITLMIIPLIILVFLKVKINTNIKNNNEVLNIFNSTLKNSEFNIDKEYINLSKMEIQEKDYIGVIKTQKDKSIPIESKCENNILDIKSACYYDNKELIILGTNLDDSFKNYKLYEIDETIKFIDTLGIISQYKIKNIKRINKLDEIQNYSADLIIVIKSYYDFKYILLMCSFY